MVAGRTVAIIPISNPQKEFETIAQTLIPDEFKNDSLIGFHLPPTNSQPHLHLHVVCPVSKLPQGKL